MAELNTSVTKLPEDKAELRIEVPPEEVKTQTGKVIRELARDLKIPGFRKGKVPSDLVIQRVGKDSILAHMLEESMPIWLQQAIDQTGLKPVEQPEVELDDPKTGLDELLDGKPFVFRAKVSVMPRPQLDKYTGIEVEKDIVSVTSADVDEQIDALRQRLGHLEEINEDRPAREGDFVLIDFTGYVDGEPLEGGAGKDYMLELGSRQFIPGFEDQIAGLGKGQSKKLKLTFPDDYRPESLAGKDVEFDVDVKEIKERILPEPDDEFATENSEFDTIAELRKDIETRIQEAREAEAEVVFKQRVVEKVVGDAQMEVPSQAVDNRARELEMDFVSSLQARGVGADEYLKMNDEEKQKFSGHFRTQAEMVLKREAVLETVADIEKIDVTDEEVDDEIRQAAPRMNKDPDELIKEMKQKGRTGIVRDDLIHRKVVDYMVEHAIPVLKKAGAVSEEEKEEAKIIEP